jgi:HK97 gp10 family phage protein
MTQSKVIIRDHLPEGIEMATIEGTQKALKKICSLITSQAKVFSPVDKGQLRSSIGYKVGDDGTGEFEAEPKDELGGVVGTATEYAVYQEFGTRYMAPNAYLRPAIAKYTTGQTSEQIAKKVIYEHVKGALVPGKDRVDFFGSGVTK